MNDNAINEFAAQLEALPLEGAVARIIDPRDGAMTSHVLANRAGYLRLAALFLRAAVAPYQRQEEADVVDVDSSEALDLGSDVYLWKLKRREDLKPDGEDGMPNLGAQIYAWSWIACYLGCLGLLLVGAVTTIKWLMTLF